MTTAINGKIMKIQMPASLDVTSGEALIRDAKQWLLEPVDIYVLDFNASQDIKTSGYRPLVILSQFIKKSGKKIVSLGLNAKLDQQLKMDGISEALNIVDNLSKFIEGQMPAKTACAGFDVGVINPFLESTKATLEKQANTKCEPQKPVLAAVSDKPSAENVAIAGVISVNAPGFTGSITLAFSEIVFLKIYESMFGEKVDSITAEIEDAAGELLNIIYGGAKAKLNAEKGMQLAPALPTILSGEKIKIRQKTHHKIIVLPFMTPFGPFQIEIAFDTAN